MRLFTRARRLAAVGAGTAAGLAVLGLPAAHADTQPPDILAGYFSPTLAPGTPGKTVQQPIQGFGATAATTITGVTVTYDVTGLAGVATLTPQSGKCSTSGSLITCHVGSVTTGTLVGPGQANPYDGLEFQQLKLVPAAGAAAGANGSYTATASGNGTSAPSATTIPVSLADGPDLQVKGAVSQSVPTVNVSAGAAYYRAIKFTNVGDQAAQGVTLEINSMGHGVDVPELRNNCQYVAPSQAYCYIPDLVAPGATETLSPAVELLTTTDLMWQEVIINVVPGYASLTGYSVGTGKPFTLVDASGAAQQPVGGQTAQSNIDFTDTTLNFSLNVPGSTADLAATASVYPGPVPGQWSVNVLPFNNGPGFIELGRSGNYMVTGDVVIPAGVTVVSVPSNWQQVPNSTPGVSEYQVTTEAIEVPANGGLYNAGTAIVQPQPGFAGDTGAFTVGINDQPPSAFAGMYMGAIDSDASNDTTTFAIPAFGS